MRKETAPGSFGMQGSVAPARREEFENGCAQGLRNLYRLKVRQGGYGRTIFFCMLSRNAPVPKV